MFLANVLSDSLSQPIKNKYKLWYTFMEQNIEFWLPESKMHTKEHCARVLLLSLLIGHQKGLNDKEMNALGIAAIFHDSRRLDDGIDRGHGKRAAEYYEDYCRVHDLPFNAHTYYIIYYHDQNDSLGLSEIAAASDTNERGVLLYRIFKDADALDRFRLAPDALDVSMLRTEEAQRLVDFAKYLLKKSRETDS
ncbi:HD domain-containing protein [Paenibacillus polymyxa]|uniref:HD domain-containing protein n=1 Tax=Paenibacillus polymyxa TaxID=1406 RepID=UPI0023F9DF90|nr:HD domain-containing protein [Paenibacillus polymyxa]